MLDVAAQARAFAMRAHGDQRYGNEPYVVHLDEVVEILKTEPTLDAEVLAIGYLHDVVEDTSVTLAELAERFGAGVMRCVDLLSDAPGRNRKERKAATYARMARVDDGPDSRALVVKVADRLANVRRCHEEGNARLLGVYRREHPTFRAAAFRDGIVGPWWDELDAALNPDD